MSQQQPKRLPLVAPTTQRAGNFERDSRLVNAYAEKTEAEEVWAVKRPALQRQLQIGSTTSLSRGVTYWNNYLLTVFNGTLHNGVAAVGAVDNSGYYTFGDYLGSSPGLFLHNSTYAYVTDGFSFTAVTDPDYPGNILTNSVVPGAVFIDGTMYVMDTNAFIYGSDLNAPTAWDPLNRVQAQIEGGAGVAIAKQQNYLVAFKNFSVEVFYDARNPSGSPLGRVEAAKLSIGCQAAETVQNIDGDLYWVARSRVGQLTVAKMSGLKYTSISSPAIERLLATHPPTDAFVLATGGHTFYGVNIGLVGGRYVALMYDIETNFWHVWSFAEAFHYSSTGGSGTSVIQQTQGGAVFQFYPELYQDMQGTGITEVGIPVDVYTPNFDGGTRYGKMLTMLEITADQVKSPVSVRFSDDDYLTWSTPRVCTLNAERVKLPDWGTFTRRAFHLHHEANTPLRLKALDLHLDICSL